MNAIVIAKAYRCIVCLVFRMKDVKGSGAIFWTVHFNWSIEQFTDCLNFRIITMDSILSLALYVLAKRFASHKLREMLLISLLQEKR